MAVRKVVKAIDANDTDEITNYTYSGRIQLFTSSSSGAKITEYLHQMGRQSLQGVLTEHMRIIVTE